MKESKSTGQRTRQRRSPSFFWPLLLIAAGVYFLLRNLGLVPDLNWGALWSLWPIFLIISGLNLIVRQFPRPYNNWLSAIVALASIALIGAILFLPAWAPFERFMPAFEREARTETINVLNEAFEAARISIDFDSTPANLFALSDGDEVLAGEISYTGRLELDSERSGDTAIITLDTDSNSGFFFVQPLREPLPAWNLGLTPELPIDLSLDSGSGSVIADLNSLILSEFALDGGSGRLEVILPGGDYAAEVDVGSGAVELTLPSSGQLRLEIDGGSGRVVIMLPASLAARVELDSGSGAFQPDDRFQLDREDGDVEIWETANFESASEWVEIEIDQGSGQIVIQQPQGR